MKLKTYHNIINNYSGIVAVETNEKANYKVGDIYRFNSDIYGIITKSNWYKNYDNGRMIIVVKLI